MLLKHLLLLLCATQVFSNSCDTSTPSFVEDNLPATGTVPPIGSLPGVATYPNIGSLNGKTVGLRISAPNLPDLPDTNPDNEIYTLDVKDVTYIAIRSVDPVVGGAVRSGKVTFQLVYADLSVVPDDDVTDLPVTFSDLDKGEEIDVYAPTAAGSTIDLTAGSNIQGAGKEANLAAAGAPAEMGYKLTSKAFPAIRCSANSCPELDRDNEVTLRFHKQASFSFDFSGWGIVALQAVLASTCPPTPPPSPPPPSPSPPPLPFVGAQRDPHLFLAHGERTDFRGKDKTWYSMLSAKNTSVNVFFENADFHNQYRLIHGSFMGRLGMVVRTALTGKMLSIEFNASSADEVSRAHVRADGVDRWVSHMSGDFELENVKVFLREKKMGSIGHGLALTVSTGRWSVQAWSKPFPNRVADAGRSLLNVKIDATYDADNDPVAPHGLVGQSYDKDDVAVEGALDSYVGKEITTKAMGEGAIEGTADDYVMPNALATVFKYSRFDAAFAKPRDVTKLTGTKTKRKIHRASTGAMADVEE